MFVPILMDVFNYRFEESSILHQVTKEMDALLKKEDTHGEEELDNYTS